MENIDQVLQKNSFEINQLLRRYRGIYSGQLNMDTINAYYNKYGSDFMLKLLAIITPKQSAFTNSLTPIQPLSGTIQTATLDTKTLATAAATAEKQSNGWSFWDKLLTSIGKTGETIAQFKIDAQGNPVPVSSIETVSPDAAQNMKMIYLAAAALVVLIVLILIFKK